MSSPTLDSKLIYSVDSLSLHRTAAPTVAEVKRQLSDIYALADKATNLDEKRAHYENAFSAIKFYSLNSETRTSHDKTADISFKFYCLDSESCHLHDDQIPDELLINLFEAYASKTCYGQGSKEKDASGNSLDSEEGFRKSARLMELSFYTQLQMLDLTPELIPTSYPTMGFESLEALIESLNFGKDEIGDYFNKLLYTSIDPTVLFNKASDAGIREIMKLTLIRMTYSHQNIAALRAPEHEPWKQIHTKFQELTEKFIGDGTTEEKRELAGYLYNRCSFLQDLINPKDWEAKVASYEPVKQLLLEAFAGEEQHTDYLSRLAQIENITGLITIRGNPAALEDAEAHFLSSFTLRERLLGQCQGDQEKADDQEYLMSNLRTALVHCLAMRKPLSDDSRLKLGQHVVALQAFIEKLDLRGNEHAYRESYTNAIVKANNALAK